MGYHVTDIQKGKYGEFSKIVEEFEELKDANSQDDKILELCEMSDLLGAMDGYLRFKYNMNIHDLYKFMIKTKTSFEEGKR
jgi:hypothetical protein